MAGDGNTATSVEPVQKKRLLRMSLAHYKNENCTEEDMYRFITEKHAVHAAALHARHGIEGHAIYFAPSTFREAAQALNASMGSRWSVRDHDVQVEFLFRDMADLLRVASDPEFHKLQADEAPYVSKIHVEVSLGWVETYVAGGEVVNVTAEGRPDFAGWKAMSAAPVVPGGPSSEQ